MSAVLALNKLNTIQNIYKKTVGPEQCKCVLRVCWRKQQKDLSLRLKTRVSVMALRLVGNWFQTREKSSKACREKIYLSEHYVNNTNAIEVITKRLVVYNSELYSASISLLILPVLLADFMAHLITF